MAKIRNFDSFGGYSHIAAPIIVKFGMVRPPRAKFYVYRGNVSPCGAKNLFLDHRVKTIPIWLRYAQSCR